MERWVRRATGHALLPTEPVFRLSRFFTAGLSGFLPRNSKRLRRSKLKVIFGEPLELIAEEFETRREMYQHMGNQMMEAIADLRDQVLNL